MSMIEVRTDKNGDIDEVVAPYSCASIHLEDLGSNGWSLIIECWGDQMQRLHLTMPKGKAIVYEADNCKFVCTDPSDEGKPQVNETL